MLNLKEVAKVLTDMANNLNLIPSTKEGRAFIRVLFILKVLGETTDIQKFLDNYDHKEEEWADKLEDLITAYNDKQDMIYRQDWVEWSEEAEQKAIEEYETRKKGVLSMLMKGEMFHELTQEKET